MQKPLLSFGLALLIWLIFLSAVSLTIFKEFAKPQITLEIDSQMLGEVFEERKPTKKSEEETPKNDKSSDLKTAEKTSSHDHHIADEAKKMAPIFNPLPQIPDDLRDEAFESSATARFFISNDGMVLRVELIVPSNSPRLNFLLLKSLKKWRFPRDNSPSTQDIRVNFLVK